MIFFLAILRESLPFWENHHHSGRISAILEEFLCRLCHRREGNTSPFTCFFYASFLGCIFWSHVFLIPEISVTHFFFVSFLGHIFLVTCFSNTRHIGHMFFLYLISWSHISVTYFCGHTFSGRMVTL